MSLHRRRPPIPEEARVLRAVGGRRTECVAILTRAPAQGPLYRAVEGVVGAIDGVAEVPAGDRRLFHPKPNTTPGGSRRAGG